MLEKLFGRAKARGGEPLHVAMLADLDVMSAEWDLLREIQASLRLLPEVILKYVKGHQDTRQAYMQLSLLAQLNVDADDQAKEYQQQHGKAHPFVLMSPHAGAFVTTPEGTITAKVVQELRSYSTGPPLRLHIQERNQWTDQIMRTINWRAHGKALNERIVRRVHFTKLVHENLPTFSRMNKLTNGERKCPACHNAEETRDHILRCSHVDRGRWRATFMTKIDEFLDQEDTSPLLQHVWREAMELWFAEPTDDIYLPPFLFPLEVRQVILHQNAIGWRQIFNGRFATAWASVQDDFLARREPNTSTDTRPTKKTKGKQWQKKFIAALWKEWTILWMTRNTMVHGKNQVARQEAQRRITEADLRSVYDNREKLEPDLQRLLFRDVQDHIERHPTCVTRNWLQTNAPILRESLRRAKRQVVFCTSTVISAT